MQAQLTTDVMPVPSLPFITADLPGIGGEIKAEPAYFVVEEIPVYEAVGEGEHVYVRLTREGWTTRALQERLVDLFGLREVDVGCAGLKDKHARVTQTFSLLLRDVDEATVAHRIEESLPVWDAGRVSAGCGASCSLPTRRPCSTPG